MDLLLWRHAEALDGSPDHTRELTERGHKQARRMARWLHLHRPQELRVLVSPTARTRQTAEAFGSGFEVSEKVGPTASAAELLTACDWPTGGIATLIVGHQPVLGRVAALLLSGREADWPIRKGALWWFSARVRQGEAQVVLRAALLPDIV